MDAFSAGLNRLLVDTFRGILKMEERMVSHEKHEGLSLSEVHFIEAVGRSTYGRTVGELAAALDITPSSVTIAANKLIKKGYLRKNKSCSDGRSVLITLTELGRRIESQHHLFHMELVDSVCSGLCEEEKQILLRGIEKLDKFFKELR